MFKGRALRPPFFLKPASMTDERLTQLENKVDEIHKALIGDTYGNKGFMQRLGKVEKFVENGKKIIWMVTGGAAVISILINVIFTIL